MPNNLGKERREMLQGFKDLWESWKVQLSFVGGALVVSAVWGTCTYETPEAEPEASVGADVNQVGETVSTTTEAENGTTTADSETTDSTTTNTTDGTTTDGTTTDSTTTDSTNTTDGTTNE